MRFSTPTQALIAVSTGALFMLAPMSPLLALTPVPQIGQLTPTPPANEPTKHLPPAKAAAKVMAPGKAKKAMIGGKKAVRTLASPGSPTLYNFTITTYDVVTSTGLLETSQTDALGNTTKMHTDGKGRTIEQVDALGNLSTAQYDNDGNPLQTRDPNGVGMNYTYDAQNRQITRTDTAATPSTFTTVYSVGGLVLNQKDAKGVSNAANTQYDAAGRVTQTTSRLATSDTTTFTYDANGNKLTLTDGEGKTTTYQYDPRNLKIAWTFPGQTSTTQGAVGYDTVQYQYDGAARLVTFIRQDGSTDNTSYAFNGTVTSKTYLKSDGVTVESQDAFTYDLSNRPLTATKGRYSNTLAFQYDAVGRKQSESLAVGGNTYPVSYAYDADNRMISTTYPDGKVVTKTYTARSQLATVTFNGQGIVAGITYDNGARETQRTLGNGASQARTYNGDNTVATLATTLPSGADAASSFNYNYDANKNLTQEAFAGGATAPFSATMTQDAKDRLVSQTRTDGDAQHFTLTNEGDWSTYAGSASGTAFTETRTHNANHQIVGISGTGILPVVSNVTPTYDQQGDLTADEQSRTYTWDQEKNLVSVTGGTTNVAFTYDVMGRRVSKINNGNTTIYVSAGSQEIAEYYNSTLTKEHVYGTYVDENLATLDSVQGFEYRIMDRRYSTTTLLDASGNVLERYVYDVYGKTTALNAAGVATGLPAMTDVLWTGRKLDNETGNYYFRSRYFSVTLGRFISRDVDYLDGANLYEGYFAWKFRQDPTGSSAYKIGTDDPFINYDAHNPWSQYNNLPIKASDIILYDEYEAIAILAPYAGYSPIDNYTNMPHAAALLKYALSPGFWYPFQSSQPTLPDYVFSSSDMDNLLSVSANAASVYSSEKQQAMDFAKTLCPGEYDITSGAVSVAVATDDDWGNALGGYDAWGKGHVSIKMVGSQKQYAMSFVYNIKDRYAWNGHAKSSSMDTAMRRLVNVGLAKEFMDRGQKTEAVNWQ